MKLCNSIKFPVNSNEDSKFSPSEDDQRMNMAVSDETIMFLFVHTEALFITKRNTTDKYIPHFIYHFYDFFFNLFCSVFFFLVKSLNFL